jgi:hypothetical protein
MHRVLCPILPQPFSLVLCPRRTVEHILFRQPAVIEHLFKLLEFRRSRAVTSHFSYPSREANDKPKTVLQVEPASVFDEPRVWLRELGQRRATDFIALRVHLTSHI